MTQITAARPLWSEGMLLCPQHMQQQDLYHEQYVEARMQAVSPAPWGVLSLQIDLPALKAGSFQLSAFAGYLPDGTPVRFDAVGSQRPPSRAIAAHFPARAESLGVWLGLPQLREGVANYLLGGESTASQRYRGVTRRVFDLTLARNERELQVSEPALALLFDDEPRKDHSALKVAELVRDEAGGFALADGYIPPCLALQAAPGLCAELQDLVGRGLAKRRRLAEERRAASGAKVELTARELEKLMFLHALDRSLGWLRHCSDGQHTHPLALYQALVGLAGALMTVNAEGDPAELPNYQYSDLRATFGPLLTELRRLLSKEFDPLCLEVPLRPHQGNSWVGELRDDRLLHCGAFVLAVEVEGDLVVASNEVPEVTKIAGWKRIGAIVRLNALGVPIRATLRPPPEIAVQPRQAYFLVDTADPLWLELMAERKIAVYLRPPYDPQRARVRLLAIPRKEG